MTSDPTSVLIVGGGLAGAKTAEALREQGYDGAITILTAEDELPYERPPLSKDLLLGKGTFDDALVHDADWYDEHDVDVVEGVEVVAIHPETRDVELGDGTRMEYGALVLATGAEPVRPPIPGVERALTLRTRADSEAVKAAFGEGRRLVVVGAGWIGLEVAAAAREAGTEVSLVEQADEPLLGVVGAELGRMFADLHREHGVELHLGAAVTSITDDGVVLADGTVLPADAVVLGVGVRPRTGLAEAAGLAVDDGVLVDAAFRTSDPRVFAVGDIAAHDHPTLGRIRVEHWATALNQPAVAAAAILGDADAAYDRLPYFFSDQYDLGLEYVGRAPADVRLVVRGSVADRELVAFWLDDEDHVLAAMNVNVWDVLDDIRPLITERVRVDQQKLADPDVPYSDVSA
jgi:3-phenylpropionate/trans-cinnamate dioxygenase ferredoxin reductase component